MKALWILLFLVAIMLAAPGALAQDDGARVYQIQPVGAKNVTAFAVAKRGNETPEAGTFNPGIDTDTNIFVVRYVETFDLAGMPFSPFAILPVGEVESTGAPRSGGFGDAQIGGTLGVIGAPALSREAFADLKPGFVASLFGRVFFPTGEYSNTQPVNLGANRFAYQVGLPMSMAWGKSYGDPSLTTLEVLPTFTFYEDNTDPFGGTRSSKDPLFTTEAHLTHNLAQGIWLSADILYRQGGETATDGIANGNAMHGWAAGGTFAFPAGPSVVALTYEHVIERRDDGPDGWFFRTALIVPL
jgi:hypothetical protein